MKQSNWRIAFKVNLFILEIACCQRSLIYHCLSLGKKVLNHICPWFIRRSSFRFRAKIFLFDVSLLERIRGPRPVGFSGTEIFDSEEAGEDDLTASVLISGSE